MHVKRISHKYSTRSSFATHKSFKNLFFLRITYFLPPMDTLTCCSTLVKYFSSRCYTWGCIFVLTKITLHVLNKLITLQYAYNSIR